MSEQGISICTSIPSYELNSDRNSVKDLHGIWSKSIASRNWETIYSRRRSMKLNILEPDFWPWRCMFTETLVILISLLSFYMKKFTAAFACLCQKSRPTSVNRKGTKAVLVQGYQVVLCCSVNQILDYNCSLHCVVDDTCIEMKLYPVV